jgi:hypothetical protein
MAQAKSDPVVSRGWWFLVVGAFTSWLFGLGLLFILAAAVCGFIGLFRQRFFHSLLLFFSSLAVGFLCVHIAAIVGIYAFKELRADQRLKPARVLSAHP